MVKGENYGTKMDEKHKYAQLGSFIDGEGTISISKDTRSRNHSYSQRLIITNSDARLIVWLVDNFGGTFPDPIKYDDENWKNVYYWKLNGRNSYKLIKKIRGHLLLKQEQADCAIDLYEKVAKWNYGGKPVSKYKQDLSKELYKRCKKLNKVGKSEYEDDNLEIKITIKKKDRTWNEYGITSKDEEAEEK